jgi:hypothetical protein
MPLLAAMHESMHTHRMHGHVHVMLPRTHTCIRRYTSIRIDTYVHPHAHIACHASGHVFSHAHMHACMHMPMHTCMHAHAYACMYDRAEDKIVFCGSPHFWPMESL